ncbi:MAG: hypothetical protein OEZ38_07420, partial [Gammaproteobacteria bacterium]|nr:hypothetical protein [Gammaproteobacteria bacterium]
MRIEGISIRAATVSIFLMIGIVAVFLSLLAGSYFRQAALNAQMTSLSRVIEVATDEMLKEVKKKTFNLGMRLAYSRELLAAYGDSLKSNDYQQLVELLDDPFVNGFVGFPDINLEKIRIYNLDLEFVAESNKGIIKLDRQLDHHLVQKITQQNGIN